MEPMIRAVLFDLDGTILDRLSSLRVYLVGLILGGALAEIAGLRPTLIVAGGCGVLGAVWLFLSPVWKMRELPRGER